ncbi:MAG: hypothetical protein RIC55_36900 [Pirellulaceae bacterium]
MRIATSLTLVLAGCAAAMAAEQAVIFTTPPSIAWNGRQAAIRFELSRSADVEVAVLDAEGGIVRHLAAGVLGGKTLPPVPLKPGLSQDIAWDGRDDYGTTVRDATTCSVRVRAGMGVRLDRIVGGDPYAYYSREMGQGDHAAWRITGLEAKRDGSVYVLGNANNYGPPALRCYDAKGDYLRTVYPPPAGRPTKEMRGWGIYEPENGPYAFQYNDLSSPALSQTLLAGTRGAIASLVPSPEVDTLLLERDQRLMKIHTDGTAPAEPMLDDLLVNEPPLAPAATTPRRGDWRLTGPMHTALSPDGLRMYLGGVFAGTQQRRARVGAEATGFWRDGQVFKIDLATRNAAVFFALPEEEVITDLKARGESPIADARYGAYAALQGVAVDAEGRVFVCDRQHKRILVLNDKAAVIREIPLAFPDAIAVSPNSSALYVTTRTGHYHERGELNLAKFADWRTDATPVFSTPLCEVRHYSQRTHLAAVEAEGEVYVWAAYTTLPVRVFRDAGQRLEVVKDFYEASTQRALDMQHLAVDAKTEHVYLPDGFNRCFRITDWSNPRLELCLQDEQTPLSALSVAIDSRNRRLYTHATKSPIVAHRLDQPLLAAIPTAADSESIARTPTMTNDWRIGLGHGDRGIAVAADGGLATLAALGTGPDYAGHLRYFPKTAQGANAQGLWFEKLGRFRAAGVRFDLQGNLYVGRFDDGEIADPPPGFDDANFRQSTGRIYKYAPTGAPENGDLFPEEPDAPAKVYDIHYGVIGNHFSRTPRFSVDGYGRIYYPTSLLSRVSVIDNAGASVLSFGTYGNRDSRGGLDGDLVPTTDVPLAWPNSVDATDDFIYVSDIVNIRLLRLAKTFAVSRTAGIR